MSRMEHTMGSIPPFNGIVKKEGGPRTNGGYKAKHTCGWELFSFHFSGSLRLHELILKSAFNIKA